MNNVPATIVTYGMVALGVTSMNPTDFKPTVFFFYYAFVLITAMMAGYYFETKGWDKIKTFYKKWVGI